MKYLQRWRQTTIANRIMSVSSFFMMVGTVALAVAAGFQYCTSRKQLTRMEDLIAQNERLINASQQQANASLEQSNTSKEQLKAITRPWVVLEDDPQIVGLLNFNAGSPYAKIKFTSRNEGGSPAFSHVIYAKLITYPQETGQGKEIPECEDKETLSNLTAKYSKVILPHRTKSVTDDIKQRDGDPRGLGDSEIYLVGCIGYNGQNPKRRPGFVHEYFTFFIEQFKSGNRTKFPHDHAVSGVFETIGSGAYP